MQSYFDALAYWDRLLFLEVKTPELLRRGTKRSHRRRQDQLLDDARGQLRDQMRSRKRRAFRGEVAVDLSIHASGKGPVPSAPQSVKRYLDAMTGIVYSDDRQVAHLTVHRFADDWPGRSVERNKHMRKPRSDVMPHVSVMVIPLRISATDWERVFRMGEQLGDHGKSGSNEFERRWLGLAEDKWDINEDERLDELRREERLDEAGKSWLNRLPPDMAGQLREWRQRDIERLTERLILDQRPGMTDHPQGGDPSFDAGLLAKFGLPDPGPEPRWELPGSFWLPLGADEGTWEVAVRNAMREHRGRWKALPTAFNRALALDIGAFGIGPGGKDIDNLAHAVLAAFEQFYCGDHRGTVVSYRAYRRPSERPGVRVLVMAYERMHELFSLIEEARSAILDGGPLEED